MFDVRCILLLSYTILSSIPNLLLLLCFLVYLSPGFILYVSGVQDPYLYSGDCGSRGICEIMFGVLTPHVLSEWMVEVCRFEVYGVYLSPGVLSCLTLGVTITIIIYYSTCLPFIPSHLFLFIFSPSQSYVQY